jgi:hypothetical protein
MTLPYLVKFSFTNSYAEVPTPNPSNFGIVYKNILLNDILSLKKYASDLKCEKLIFLYWIILPFESWNRNDFVIIHDENISNDLIIIDQSTLHFAGVEGLGLLD